MRSTRPTPDEFEQAALEYVEAVASGRLPVGRLERLAVERHVRDLADGEARGLRFVPARARLFFAFVCRYARHTKGEWAGQPVVLEGWEAFLCWELFGWVVVGSDGAPRRRFRTLYLSVARKNGKTMLAALIALYMFAAANEPGAEVYIAATKRDQAKVTWQQARSIVRKDPELRRKITVHESVSNMSLPEWERKLEALGADYDTLDGLNAFCAVVDELHAHKDRGVWDVLESSTGARREPLMVGTTTAGARKTGLCWDLDHDAQRILEGVIADDSTLAFVCRLDPDDDWADESVWRKANPNLGVSVKPDSLREGCAKAKNNPSALNEFRRKRLNLWTDTHTVWLPIERWDECADPDLDLLELAGSRAYLAADLSSTTDFTALVLAVPRDDGSVAVFPFFFIPGETVPERVRQDRVPVDVWVERKHVIATDGDVVDQDAVKLKILELARAFDLIEVPFDPHNATKLQSELIDLGIPVVDFRQGWVTMSPAIQQTEILILKQRVAHDGNPVLRWMFGNVALRMGPSETRRFDKERAADRIDGVVAMTMALARAVGSPGASSVYETRDVRVV